jgi:hypothetical protein
LRFQFVDARQERQRWRDTVAVEFHASLFASFEPMGHEGEFQANRVFRASKRSSVVSNSVCAAKRRDGREPFVVHSRKISFREVEVFLL